jgi:predicted TIM-barrel fold metal-dependent hydrolase
MTIDVHAYAGPWAFRHVPDTDPDALVRRLGRAGIQRALVAATEAVLFKDPQEANRLLAERVRGQGKDARGAHLLPVASLNPRLAGWERDLQWCLDVLAPVGLRLHPNYHGYALAGAEAGALIGEAVRAGLIVFIVNRIEDERVHHPLARVAPLPVGDLAAALRAAPHGKIVLCGLRLAEVTALVEHAPDLTHYAVDISHVQHPLDALERLRDVLPAHRLLLGSGFPLLMPEAAVYKVLKARLPEEEKQAILEGNAARLLGARGEMA